MFNKILKKLYLVLQKHFKEEHLSKHKNDLKCTNCNEWCLISGIKHKHEIKDHETNDSVYITICGQCKHTSYWNADIAPFPVLCDVDGFPLESKEFQINRDNERYEEKFKKEVQVDDFLDHVYATKEIKFDSKISSLLLDTRDKYRKIVLWDDQVNFEPYEIIQKEFINRMKKNDI